MAVRAWFYMADITDWNSEWEIIIKGYDFSGKTTLRN